MMPLSFLIAWRFSPPNHPSLISTTVPQEALDDLKELAQKLSGFSSGGMWDGVETFKKNLYHAAGIPYSGRSSSEGWAVTDLGIALSNLQSKPPLLIEAFVDAGRALQDSTGRPLLSDPTPLNEVLSSHRLAYTVQGDELLLTGGVTPSHTPAPTLLENTHNELWQRWSRADQLLSENRPREAVDSIWYVVESVLLVYRGTKVGDAVVEGTYFNEIAKSLRKASGAETGLSLIFPIVLKIAEQLQSFLSAPNQGGVRHGIAAGTAPIDPAAAKLLISFCKALSTFLCEQYTRLAPSG